ncbi:DUF2092 domain-containing protein [Crenobacter sp. HX-7-9]|uniref:DUF2092 domain-containing protein n=2 Tax=Crenobacter caeni TaxID=2705474 RepID=A0A6B2KWF9_9NEIS|nr:DUF2092 domain-containing protein [Crenobacter caeni]
MLALLSLPCQVTAQTPPAPGQQAAPAVDPQAIEALRGMGRFLEQQKRFEIRTTVMGERVLADGQKLQHTARATLEVERPRHLRILTEGRKPRELFYNGQLLTLYSPQLGEYSSVPFDGSLEALVERLEQYYGVELPLADLFIWGSPDAPFQRISSAMYAGQADVDGVLCDHYAFRQGKADWQLWIAAEGPPLPRKLAITYRGDEARPQSVSLIDWKLSPAFSGQRFTFVPPAGARQVVLPVRAADAKQP